MPYPPGGPYDVLPRIVAQWITAQHGWPVVVDNRTGATGVIGIMAAKQAAPDGHTLVVASTSTHGSMPALKRNLTFDPINDFAPVVLIADATLVLLVRDELPVRNVAELIALLRDKPGALTYSSGGFGSPQHLATVTMFQRAGLSRDIAVHLPFGGLGPALMALIAGNSQFMFVSTGLAMPHIASGKLRALANSSLKRPPRLPEVKTMAELGFADFEVMPWCGLAAPAGTPDAIRGALERTHQRGAARSESAGADSRDRLRHPRRHAGRIRPLYRARHRPLQEARRRHEPERGLTRALAPVVMPAKADIQRFLSSKNWIARLRGR